jgi:hypothetical protein
MALGSIQSPTEMSTSDLPRVKCGLPARKADNLAAMCASIIQKRWGLYVSKSYGPPQPVTKESFTFICFLNRNVKANCSELNGRKYYKNIICF